MAGVFGELVEQAAHGRADVLGPAPARPGVGLAGQLVEVGLLVFVQPQRARRGWHEHGRRGLNAALLQPRVVVDADGGEPGDFLAAQPGRPCAWCSSLGQADLPRRELRAPASLEEFANFVGMTVLDSCPIVKPGEGVRAWAGSFPGRDLPLLPARRRRVELCSARGRSAPLGRSQRTEPP